MEIKFINKKIVYILSSVACFVFYIVLNIIFVPRLIEGIKAQNLQETLFCLLMMFIFLILGAFGAFIVLQIKNHITLKDDCIEGYYNGKIKIFYKDIECIGINYNQLCFVLHNGKSYHINNVQNTNEAYKKIFISSPNLVSDCKKINQRKKKNAKSSKIYLISVVSLLIIMFIAAFVCVALTGARDIPEFTQKDKIIFIYFIIFEFLIIIASFLVAILGAKYIRNKWALDNMINYATAKKNKNKNLDKYKDKLIFVKYMCDYSFRYVAYEKDEENKVFVVERYYGNLWHTVSHEFVYKSDDDILDIANRI